MNILNVLTGMVENSFVGVRDVAPIVIKGDVITWETISGRQRFLAGEGLTGISGILKNSNLATNNLRTVKRYVTIEETGGE